MTATTEINIFPKDSPLRARAAHRAVMFARLFSGDTRKKLVDFLTENKDEIGGIGIDIQDKSVVISIGIE